MYPNYNDRNSEQKFEVKSKVLRHNQTRLTFNYEFMLRVMF